MQFAVNYCQTRARWVADAAHHAVRPDTYEAVRRCSDGVVYRGQGACRGVVVFLHGVNASWWQWRNVASEAMARPELRDYAFYVPDLLARGNAEPADVARAVVERVCDAVAQLAPAPFDLVLVGTSMGARVAAHVEVALAARLPVDRVRRLVFVSVAGFFGPCPSALLAARLCLPLTWLGYHPAVAAAAVSAAPHVALLDAWRPVRAAWPSAHYLFLASHHDEVLSPVAASLPWPPDPLALHGPRTEHVAALHADHSGSVPLLAPRYLSWLVAALASP